MHVQSNRGGLDPIETCNSIANHDVLSIETSNSDDRHAILHADNHR